MWSSASGCVLQRRKWYIHLVYIAVILRPLQSIIIVAMCLCLLESILAEVSDNLLKIELYIKCDRICINVPNFTFFGNWLYDNYNIILEEE